MSMNWKTARVIIAVVVILGASLWTINSIRPNYHEGMNLEFPIREGIVQVTNESDALQVQLISPSLRTFNISSPSENISGNSIRQETDSRRTQVYEFVLPSGMTEFSVSGNTNVIFEANSDTNLDATVYPLRYEAVRTRLIMLVVFVLAVLFYISYLYDHLWLSAARRQGARDDVLAQENEQDNFDRIMERRTTKRRP